MELDLPEFNHGWNDPLGIVLYKSAERRYNIIVETEPKEGRSMDREFTPEDLSKNKTMAALGYIVFFVPLLMCRNSKVGKYCANQGLILLVLMVLVSILGNIFAAIPFIGWLFTIAANLVSFALFCVGIVCFAQMMTHENVVELPYVGGFKLLP